jgi:hypothetical protein
MPNDTVDICVFIFSKTKYHTLEKIAVMFLNRRPLAILLIMVLGVSLLVQQCVILAGLDPAKKAEILVLGQQYCP